MVADASPEVGIRVSPTNINSTIAVGDETNEIVTLQNLSTAEIVVRNHVSPNGKAAEPEISVASEQVTLKLGDAAGNR